MTCILIVGGYGTFGMAVAERLARVPTLELIIAGRQADRAAEGAFAVATTTGRPHIRSAVIDATRLTPRDLQALGPPEIVINASGPFHTQNYELARAAIEAGCHYIDLADARAFVSRIGELDRAAREKGVLVVSGASSVPGLSSAVVESLAARMSRMMSVRIGISPGNRFDPGVATVCAILSGLGAPIVMRLDGKERVVHGWQGLGRHTIGDLGSRWMGYVDVPDLDLIPERHPELDTLTFQAGVEVGLMHLSLWAMSWLVRCGALKNPAHFARPLLDLKQKMGAMGSDRGGMFVEVEGWDRAGRRTRIEWTLVANSGHGPYVPGIPSVLLAKRLADGTMQRRGATPCYNLFTPEDFAREVADLDIHFDVQVSGCS